MPNLSVGIALNVDVGGRRERGDHSVDRKDSNLIGDKELVTRVMARVTGLGPAIFQDHINPLLALFSVRVFRLLNK